MYRIIPYTSPNTKAIKQEGIDTKTVSYEACFNNLDFLLILVYIAKLLLHCFLRVVKKVHISFEKYSNSIAGGINSYILV